MERGECISMVSMVGTCVVWQQPWSGDTLTDVSARPAGRSMRPSQDFPCFGWCRGRIIADWDGGCVSGRSVFLMQLTSHATPIVLKILMVFGVTKNHIIYFGVTCVWLVCDSKTHMTPYFRFMMVHAKIALEIWSFTVSMSMLNNMSMQQIKSIWPKTIRCLFNS